MTTGEFTPRIFTTRAGQTCEARPHKATFRGRHNKSKTKALMVLYHRLVKQGEPSGLVLAELHKQSGVDYTYLKSRLAFWVKWGYIQNRVVISYGRPCFSYSLAERGRHFIADIVPGELLTEYAAEIRAFKASQGQ